MRSNSKKANIISIRRPRKLSKYLYNMAYSYMTHSPGLVLRHPATLLRHPSGKPPPSPGEQAP